MSALELSFESDFQIWDFRAQAIYDYRRGGEQLFELLSDCLLLPPGTAEREPSEGAYVLRRRMMFMPLAGDIYPLSGDSFKIETEHDDWAVDDQQAAGQLENAGGKLYERWYVESVSKTWAMYACRCVRAELIAAHCQEIVISRPKAASDRKGSFVTVQEPWLRLHARVQPAEYQEVDEQARKMFKRFYKVWVNPDLEVRHRGLVVELEGEAFQIVDVRSRRTMQDLTELLVAANV